jgi:hypothetical protein
MRNAIHTFAMRRQAMLKHLRASWWRLQDLIDDTVRMLADGMSGQARRMRPIPIRVERRPEHSNTRR